MHSIVINKEKNKKLKEMYEKCLLIYLNSKNKNLTNEDSKFKDFLDFRGIEKQNLNKKLKTFKVQKSFEKNENSLSNQQIIFSTLSRINYKKKINLLFSIQEFVSINNEVLSGRSSLSRRRGEKKSKEYSEILLCMKKLKTFYGFIPLKQLNKILFQAKKAPGYFSKNFFSLIERRLDVILYRSGYAKTIVAARQACLHSKVYINSKLCRIPSTQLNPGDIISLSSSNENEILKKPILSKGISSNVESIETSNSTVLNKLTFPRLEKLSGLSTVNLKLLALIFAKPISSIISQKSLNSLLTELKTKNNELGTRLDLKNSMKKLVGFNDFNSISFEDSLNENKNNFKTLIQNQGFSEISKNKEYEKLLFLLNKKNQNKKSFLFHNLVNISKKLEYYSPKLTLQVQKYIYYSLTTISKCFLFEHNSNEKHKFKNRDTTKNILNLINKLFFQNSKKSLKTTHLEISPITNNIIFLYSPQKVVLPFHFDIDILLKTMYK